MTVDQQWLFEALLSQPTISNAGVLALTPRPWARLAEDMTAERVEAALAGLAAKRYVVLDEDTGELLVRTFMRNDGVSSNGKVFKNALKVALQVQSEALRRVLAAELRKVGTEDARQAAAELAPDADAPVPTTVHGGNSTSDRIADQKKSERPQKSCGVGEGVGEGGKSPSVGGSVSSNRRRSDSASARAIDKAFDEFWSAYPRREAKKGARVKFGQAVKSGTDAATIIAGARRYAAYVAQVGREREKIKIPTTWLNNGCWDDELNGPTTTQAPKPTGDLAEWLRERWQAGDAAGVARLLGERYERPDIPVAVDGKDAIAAFFRTSARAWIEDHRGAVLAKLTGKAAA
ncbi:hypothetical protein QRX60_16950 [Amycolatopsis mongoliensis]|uniref:Uncharacterized protein n=1 Tax=Amycolatopsis mongoliensis TaxID=715475 RepID=A0A9Y2NHN7_9PSEU|nr:hypothetical protein [Amycolatopsis sp. 4-36]WIY05447.1 hypothetical protein QRX60_16950 [Amycolatopsis sp. 4-36]